MRIPDAEKIVKKWCLIDSTIARSNYVQTYWEGSGERKIQVHVCERRSERSMNLRQSYTSINLWKMNNLICWSVLWTKNTFKYRRVSDPFEITHFSKCS
jgi:hypothetical protein